MRFTLIRSSFWIASCATVIGFAATASSCRAQGFVDPRPTLGTFEPTPYIIVGGGAPASEGYTPVMMYGDSTLTVNGPLSAMRFGTAPIVTYNRGYDGVLRPVEGTTTTTPNMPRLSPFTYPTRRNNYYAPRTSRPTTPASAIDWLDLN